MHILTLTLRILRSRIDRHSAKFIVILSAFALAAILLQFPSSADHLASIESDPATFSPRGPAGGIFIPASCTSYEHIPGECALPPGCSASVSPMSATAGTPYTISWSSIGDADSTLQYNCTGSGGSGNAFVEGSFPGNYPADSQTCTFAVVGPLGDTATCSYSYNVLPPTPAPTVSPFCDGAGVSKATISWSSGGETTGYGVDVDNDTNWGNGYWNKGVGWTT